MNSLQNNKTNSTNNIINNSSINGREFIKKLLAISLPIMGQIAITNFVSMLDNIMVGQVGTLEMTGVSVSNQLIFIYNMAIFGAVTGIGVFEAQFAGKKDHDGIRYSLRFKLMAALGLTLIFVLAVMFAGKNLIGLYLKGEGSPEDAAASLIFGFDYIKIILIGLVPFAISQSYCGTLRQTGKTLPPMIASLSAVFVNLSLNYILIFGKFGAPKLGIIGAAIATVVSRFVEMLVLVIYTHSHNEENKFAKGLYSSLRVPLSIINNLVKTGFPLMMNELIWVFAMTFSAQCYSTRGLHVVAAYNINNTFWNVFSVAFIAVGTGVGIVIGQFLGAGKLDEAKYYSKLSIVISLIIGVVTGAMFFVLAKIIPLAYNTTDQVRELATAMMRVCAVCMPIEGVVNSCYFTMRSGGKLLVTFLFDSIFMWIIVFPLAFYFCNYTSVDIRNVYFITQFASILKAIIGIILVNRGFWVRNLVDNIDIAQ